MNYAFVRIRAHFLLSKCIVLRGGNKFSLLIRLGTGHFRCHQIKSHFIYVSWESVSMYVGVHEQVWLYTCQVQNVDTIQKCSFLI